MGRAHASYDLLAPHVLQTYDAHNGGVASLLMARRHINLTKKAPRNLPGAPAQVCSLARRVFQVQRYDG